MTAAPIRSGARLAVLEQRPVPGGRAGVAGRLRLRRPRGADRRSGAPRARKAAAARASCNTHSHSDHIGGNAAAGGGVRLPHRAFPRASRRRWRSGTRRRCCCDSTAQSAARFAHDEVIAAGDELRTRRA
ncbi:MAG: hypothetical protein MZW92_04940 [Comamonadaceae bacterium]|nr:hypothetical protein [Comamonadaceae bacterium]